jgi:hypothetical protein
MEIKRDIGERNLCGRQDTREAVRARFKTEGYESITMYSVEEKWLNLAL